MYGYIYKCTCLSTNKIYVGQHKSDTFDDKYWGSGINWIPILEQYGHDNVKREVLQWCETAEELYAQERFWIAKLNARNPEIGYNISAGGFTPSLPGESNPMFGKTHTTEARLIISKTNKGIKRTEEFKEKRRKFMKNKKWYNNGEEEHYFNVDEIPQGYVEGRLPRKSKVLSDKEVIIQSVKQMLGSSYSTLPKKVVNNGIFELMLPICPDGFVYGRLPSHQVTLTKALKGKPFPEEGKEKLSRAMSGKNNPMYGVHRKGKDAPTYGKHTSEQTKELIRSKLIGRIHVTDGTTVKSIHPAELTAYLEKGFEVKKHS